MKPVMSVPQLEAEKEKFLKRFPNGLAWRFARYIRLNSFPVNSKRREPGINHRLDPNLIACRNRSKSIQSALSKPCDIETNVRYRIWKEHLESLPIEGRTIAYISNDMKEGKKRACQSCSHDCPIALEISSSERKGCWTDAGEADIIMGWFCGYIRLENS